jgi:hypothetical protein
LFQWLGSHHHQNGKPHALARDAPRLIHSGEKGAVSDQVETFTTYEFKTQMVNIDIIVARL